MVTVIRVGLRRLKDGRAQRWKLRPMYSHRSNPVSLHPCNLAWATFEKTSKGEALAIMECSSVLVIAAPRVLS